jgi:serine phosphatase RsbU (regulator of sigma subunit)
MSVPEESARASAGVPANPAAGARGRSRRWRPSLTVTIAFLIGLAVTAALALTALAVYNNNEDRLLRLRGRELSLVIAASVPSIQTPLASAAELADATGGSPAKFRAFIAPYVGPGKQFVSVSLWRLGGAHPKPTAVVGAAPQLASLRGKAATFFAGDSHGGVLRLMGILSSPHPVVGFEFSSHGHGSGYAAYSENPLPANRRSRIENNSAFSDLNYAVYLGRSTRSSDVVVRSVKRLPITGRRNIEGVPFGAGAFTLVITPRGSLGGAFFRDLPWIIAIFGVLIAFAAALLTGKLARDRHNAERMAGVLDRVAAENRDMYTEQRSISKTLQHALLPDLLPKLQGLQVSARYVPAGAGMDVGGDWYDVVSIDSRRAVLVIGDVSGHGLRAATTMALVRHAALAYVAQDHSPATVLTRLSDFVNGVSHDYFATVLCALIDADTHELTMASAGHLPPLLIENGTGEYAEGPVGVPIGVARKAPYREATRSVPPQAVLIAFTDGLVERRGEVLDVGLVRLLQLAVKEKRELDDLLGELARDLASGDHRDDTAMVGIQWQS